MKLTEDEKARAEEVFALADAVLQIEIDRAKKQLAAGDEPLGVAVGLSMEYEQTMDKTLAGGLIARLVTQVAESETVKSV